MRGTTSLNMGACVGLKETLAANRPGGGTDRYPLNQYLGKSFFEDENYRAALDRLDGGYEISIDFIEWMQDYCDNEHEQARNLVSYAGKWTTRLKQQSSLASYNTTKRAQLDVVRITRELARLKESTCTDIQKVIDKYRNYVNEIYITERFRPGRKHRRTNEFKKLFKTAHASLREVFIELEALCTQEKKARDALRTADTACEILDLDPTISEKQRARAYDVQMKKRALLKNLEEKVDDVKEKHKTAQKTYRIKATEIFKQCQYVEEERLDQIRETLLDFIQTMYTSKYSTELNQIFEGLTMKITTQQNSFDDLLFWAKTYGIDNKLTVSVDDEEEEEDITESRTTKNRSTVDEEEPSATVKTKVKRTKSTAIVDKKNTNATEPSTTNNTVLNHV